MAHRVPPDWRQMVEQWRHTLSRVWARWQPQQQELQQEDEPIWAPSLFIASCPVHTVTNDDDDIIVAVALPGVEPADITLTLEKNRLLIQGKAKRALQTEGRDPAYAERSACTCIRSAVLPCAVDLDQAYITRQNGLLQITLPKRADVLAG